MNWAEGASSREMVLLGAGTLLALFGWELFRLARTFTAIAAGTAAGWVVFEAVGLPPGLAAKGMEPVAWSVLLLVLGGLGGYLVLRRIRSLGSFLPGVLLGFLTAKSLLRWLGSQEPWWSPVPSLSLLAAVAGGVAVLVSERHAVIIMTAFIGSCLAGSIFPWELAPLGFFAVTAPLQWWVQAGRPFPLGRGGGEKE